MEYCVIPRDQAGQGLSYTHTEMLDKTIQTSLFLSTMPIIYVFFSPLQNILPDILFAFSLLSIQFSLKPLALFLDFNSKELNCILHFL